MFAYLHSKPAFTKVKVRALNVAQEQGVKQAAG